MVRLLCVSYNRGVGFFKQSKYCPQLDHDLDRRKISKICFWKIENNWIFNAFLFIIQFMHEEPLISYTAYRLFHWMEPFKVLSTKSCDDIGNMSAVYYWFSNRSVNFFDNWKINKQIKLEIGQIDWLYSEGITIYSVEF